MTGSRVAKALRHGIILCEKDTAAAAAKAQGSNVNNTEENMVYFETCEDCDGTGEDENGDLCFWCDGTGEIEIDDGECDEYEEE